MTPSIWLASMRKEAETIYNMTLHTMLFENFQLSFFLSRLIVLWDRIPHEQGHRGGTGQAWDPRGRASSWYRSIG